MIITRDRAAQLERTLRHLTALPEQPPIVVVDNASRDATAAIAEAAGPGVRCVSLPRNAGAAGRNVGAASARTPYVAFSDDDSWWAAGALERAARIFDEHPQVGLLAARILVGPEERIDPVSAEMQRRSRTVPGLPGPSIVGFVACGAIVRRDAFLDAGGFDRRFGVGGEEDLLAIDLARRGWALCYAADVIAHHWPAAEGVRPGRHERLLRNALWTAWLRYPRGDALRFTAQTVAQAWRDGAPARAGLGAALLGLPSILADREPVDRALQARLRPR